MSVMLENRREAGIEIAGEMKRMNMDDAVVFAIPRGGVIIGNEIAQIYNLELELALMTEIRHPLNSEFTIGFVGNDQRMINWSANIALEYVNLETDKIRKKLREIYYSYTGKYNPDPVFNKKIILVSDVVYNDNNLLQMIRLLKRSSPSAVVVVTPATEAHCIDRVAREVREFIFLDSFDNERNCEFPMFPNFNQVSDEEIQAVFHDHLMKN